MNHYTAELKGTKKTGYAKVYLNNVQNTEADVATIYISQILKGTKYKTVPAIDIANKIANALNMYEQLQTKNSKTNKKELFEIINKYK